MSEIWMWILAHELDCFFKNGTERRKPLEHCPLFLRVQRSGASFASQLPVVVDPLVPYLLNCVARLSRQAPTCLVGPPHPILKLYLGDKRGNPIVLNRSHQSRQSDCRHMLAEPCSDCRQLLRHTWKCTWIERDQFRGQSPTTSTQTNVALSDSRSALRITFPVKERDYVLPRPLYIYGK